MHIISVTRVRSAAALSALALSTTLLLGNSLAAPPAQARSVTYSLDIPPQPLDVALQRLALVSQHKLLYKSELVEGRNSVALKGQYTAEEAVQTLLSATNLTYEITPASVVLIRSKETANAASDARPAGLRLAQASAGDRNKNASKEPTDSSSSPVLQEVTVTARFHTESVQHTPIAVTAVDSELIQLQGLTNIAQVAQNAPNVVLQRGADQSGGFALTAIIRGVGQTSFNFGQAPGVGFYLDDVYFGTLVASNFDLGDTDRVEILRGPQGTLFGRNSQGGAIRMFTKNATGDGTGFVQAGVGSREHIRVQGGFDIPLIDNKLFLRVNAGTDAQDGYVDRIDFGCRNPTLRGNLPIKTTTPDCKLGELGGYNIQSGHIALRALPAPDLTIDFKVNLLRDRSDNTPTRAMAVTTGLINPATGKPWTPTAYAYNSSYLIPVIGVPADNRFVTTNPYESYETFNDLRTGLTVPDRSTLDQAGGVLNVDWEIASGLTLTSVSGYQWYQGLIGSNPSGIPLFSGVENGFNHRQWSEELRLGRTSPLFGRDLDWTVGGYYYDEHNLLTGSVSPVYLGLAFRQDDPSTDEVKSAFAHGVLHLTDKFNLELGYRLTDETKTYAFVRKAIMLNNVYVADQNVSIFQGQKGVAKTHGRGDYKVSVNYQFDPDIMAYATVATGFKSGGINPFPTAPYQIVPFGPEDLTSYELGMKTQWFGRRLRLNPTIYYNHYTGLQRTAAVTQPEVNPFSSITNVGEVRIQGFELEAAFEPMDGLIFDAAVGYIDFKTISLGGATGINPDVPPPLVPQWMTHFGGQYTFKLGGGGSITARLDETYQTKVYFDQLGSVESIQQGYGLLNGQLSYTTPDATWLVKLEGKNLTNKYYYYNESNLERNQGTLTGSVGRPREFLVSIRRNF